MQVGLVRGGGRGIADFEILSQLLILMYNCFGTNIMIDSYNKVVCFHFQV